jgi:hypothetical protein
MRRRGIEPAEERRIGGSVNSFRRWNLGSLVGVLVLSFTVVTVLAIGIVAAYATVIGILHTFASHTGRPSSGQLVLMPNQARAAHASGD